MSHCALTTTKSKEELGLVGCGFFVFYWFLCKSHKSIKSKTLN